MIQIKECQKSGYPARTEGNIVSSDITIAIAQNFSTAGERLTMGLCRKWKRLFIPIAYGDYYDSIGIVAKINEALAHKQEITINFAGNGIYTLEDKQSQVNEEVYTILKEIVENPMLIPKITLVRSGGQTGIDEAGVIAAERLGIPALVLAPKGWKFRTKDGDFADEKLFKQRFQ